jgi:large subunit ribosomal protein L34e
MVQRSLRGRNLKRRKVKTPGKRLVIHYKEKKHGIPICAICKKPLHGVPHLKSTDMRKLPKTKRRPERPYGGNLCSKCMREFFRKSVRETFNK